MKLFRILLSAGPLSLFVLLFAAPGFAQFEVNPDHFDAQPKQSTTKPATTAKKQVVRLNPPLKAPAKKTAGTINTANRAGAQHQVSAAARHATHGTSRGTATAKLHESHSNLNTAPDHINSPVEPIARE